MFFGINEYINELKDGCGVPRVNFKPIFEADYEGSEYSDNEKLQEYKEKNESEIEKIFDDFPYFKTQEEIMSDLFLGVMRMSNRFAAQAGARMIVALDESINRGVIIIDSFEFLIMSRDIVLFYSMIISSSEINIVPYNNGEERCAIVLQFNFTEKDDKIVTMFHKLIRKTG